MSAFRDRPSPTVDSVTSGPGGSRGGRYGEVYSAAITGKETFLADEGSYFTARTPTPGTGIVGHAAPTTFDELKPYLVLYNGGLNRIYPQFLRLHETVVSTGAVRTQFTICLDTGNRLSSAGTACTTQNCNMDSVVASQAVVTVGAVVATAASANRRIIDHIVFRGTIDVVEDVYEIAFGSSDGAGQGGSRAATVQDFARMTAPVVVGPGQSLLVHQWAGSQSVGPTFQVTLGYSER